MPRARVADYAVAESARRVGVLYCFGCLRFSGFGSPVCARFVAVFREISGL